MLWATNSAIWDWDIERNQFWSSAGHQILFGHGETERTEKFSLDDDSSLWVMLMHPNDRERVLQHARNHLERDEPYDVAYRHQLPSGEYKWIRSIGRAVRDAAGRPIRMVGSDTDITAQKTAEKDHNERENLYRTIYRSATVAIATTDLNGRFINCNPAYQEMLGYSAAELSKMSFSDLTPDEDVAANLARFGEVVSGEQNRTNFEKRYIRKDGSVCWVEISTSPLHNSDGEIVATIAVVHEITERKQAEEARRISEEKYRSLFENAHDSILVIDPANMHFIDVNQNAAWRLGYTREELLELNVPDINLSADDDLFHTNFQKILSEGENKFDAVHVRKDGSHMPVEVTSRCIKFGNRTVVQSFVRDISERQHVENALRASEARLQEAQRTAHVGSWEFDLSAKELKWSAEIYRIFNTTPGEFQPGTDTFYDLVHEDDRDRVRRIVDDAFRSNKQNNYEYRIVHNNGDVRWLHEVIGSIVEASGRQASRFGTVQDITDRKLMEQALAESGENLRAIMENVADGLATIDEAGIVQSFNKSAEKMFGYSAAEVVGGRIELLMAEPERSRHQSFIENYRDTGIGKILGQGPREVEGRHKDGSAIPLELAVAEMHIGGQRYFIGSMRDTRERKAAEMALRESEAWLSESQEIASLGAWDVNHDTGEFFWSDEVYRIFGVDKATFRPTVDSFYASIHPDDVEAVRNLARESNRAGQHFEFQHRIILPNGDVRVVHERARPYQDENGRVYRERGTVQDITEQQRVEEQLFQAQKMEAVGQLTGGIAHDFNNLLTVIIGTLELGKDHLDKDNDGQILLKRGLLAAERGAALTDRLLAFSRKQILQPAAIDLNEMVSDMLDMLRRTLGEVIKIETVGARDLWICHADQAQLENALLNLSINARDAMAGGGRLTIETANISLTDPEAAAGADVTPGRYVMLTVSDTGSGMTAETLNHAFEPFYTTKDVGKGSGLGLSMVYGFAKQSGGSVMIETILGQGSTIKLYIPVAANA